MKYGKFEGLEYDDDGYVIGLESELNKLIPPCTVEHIHLVLGKVLEHGEYVWEVETSFKHPDGQELVYVAYTFTTAANKDNLLRDLKWAHDSWAARGYDGMGLWKVYHWPVELS